MKKILILLTSLSFNYYCYGQKALTFGQAKSQGISVEHLDSIYASGIDTDEKLSVFKTNQDKYFEAYQNLLQDFGKFLKKNNFLWSKTTKGFNRIYFDKSGKIEYFLYNFKPDQLTKEQEKTFGDLLQSFIKTYTFPLKASRKFAQCSPVTYMPATK